MAVAELNGTQSGRIPDSRERQFRLHYTNTSCNCDHCVREHVLPAFNRVDAINQLAAILPFAWVLRTEVVG